MRSPFGFAGIRSITLLITLTWLVVVPAQCQTLTILHRFPGTAWFSPPGLGPDGALYGFGGSGTEAFAYRFTEANGAQILPAITSGFAAPFQGPDGALYGFDWNESGRIFRFTPEGEAATVAANLGDILGATSVGSDIVFWTVHRIYVLRPGDVPQLLHRFDEYVGLTTMVPGHDGALYGVAWEQKPYMRGVRRLFRLQKSGEFTWLCKLPRGSAGGANSIVLANDGRIFGTTESGGLYRAGYFYSWTPGHKAPEVLYHFTGGKGYRPNGQVVFENGYVYGTALGGPGGHGVVYRISTGGDFQLVYAFSGLDDGTVQGGLIKSAESFFGATSYKNAAGTETGKAIFKLDVPGTINEPGPWDGLLRTTTSDATIVGSTSLKLNSTGSFSIALQIGRNRASASGAFDSGDFSKRLVTANGAYDLRMRWLPSGRVHGTISNSALTAAFDQVPALSDVTPFWVNRPNLNLALVERDSGSSSRPGYANFRRRGTDRTRVIGSLPDGTPFSTAITVGQGLQFGVFTPLGGGRRIAGTLHTGAYADGGIPKTNLFPGQFFWKREGSSTRLEAIHLR